MPRKKASQNTENEAAQRKIIKGRFNLPIPERRNVEGKVFVVGSGETGQLGLGEDIMERKRLYPVNELTNIVDVCAGGMHNLALNSDGELYSFGCNDEGALGRDSSEGGIHESLPGRVVLPGKVVRISAGDSHSACILEDGSVYAWGSFRDSHGNMGLTVDGNKLTPVHLLQGTQCHDIASGADHLVMLTAAGKVFTVGCAEQGQLGRVSERSVSGEGRRGKVDLLRPTELLLRNAKHIDAIWATNYCTFMRDFKTKSIYAVGLNNYKQLAFDGNDERILIPKKTIFTDVKQIAGGQHHTLVLTNDGICYAIGRQDYGRLGLGPINKKNDGQLLPVAGLTGKNVCYIACGESCSFAITADGKLYSWGFGESCQLGVGSGDDELTPKLVESKHAANVHMLFAGGGGQHAIFLAKQSNSVEKEAAPKKTAVKRKSTDSKEPTAAPAETKQQNGNINQALEETVEQLNKKVEPKDKTDKTDKLKPPAAKRGRKK